MPRTARWSPEKLDDLIDKSVTLPARARAASRQARLLALTDNIRGCRAKRRLTQDDLAARMRELGQETWSRATVSEIERSNRNVTVAELLSLAEAFDTSLENLLSPL